MKTVYSSFENGKFCIDIKHARAHGIAGALMVSQFRQDDERLFCRSFNDGWGVSRRYDDVLPICDKDALSIIFSAFKPGRPIPELGTIDELLAKRDGVDGEEWVGSRAALRKEEGE